MALPLFDPPPAPPIHGPHVGPGTPEYAAFWTAFHVGAAGARPMAASDDRVGQYARDGFRIGRLFRPLPCMQENR